VLKHTEEKWFRSLLFFDYKDLSALLSFIFSV
jgi:hypothetical protein